VRILHDKDFGVVLGKQPKPDIAEISQERAEHFFKIVSYCFRGENPLDKRDIIGAIRTQLLSDFEAIKSGEDEV
jgi:hypothetical protein